ncbi:MAG: hypothetical protein ONB44_19530 [candidate division KSB1 bacterium]|nr:hypothetical protein [candidate division KSB1 bacterium]MDZ7304322.1 hypothetical protein [candidate division KSB1 bacterium]MDZ7313598.1 hypothetical protein [candidate division KSB1 bacterium]
MKLSLIRSVSQVEIPDGTPLLDLEPSVASFDQTDDFSVNWFLDGAGEDAAA